MWRREEKGILYQYLSFFLFLKETFLFKEKKKYKQVKKLYNESQL
jgi:hypothetical protein